MNTGKEEVKPRKPRIPEGKERVSIVLWSETVATLETAAVENFRTLNLQIEKILQEWVESSGDLQSVSLGE
jgi:hypothetical protein